MANGVFTVVSRATISHGQDRVSSFYLLFLFIYLFIYRFLYELYFLQEHTLTFMQSFIIIPSTFKPDILRSFQLNVYSEDEFTLDQI